MFWPRSGCSPVPGRPIWPVISDSAIRQRALSVPWVCCETPMPQKMIALSARAKVRATLRSTSGSMPQIGAISSGVKSLMFSAELVEALDIGLDVLLVVKLLGDDDVEHAVEHRHVGAVLELHHVPGVALERLAARVHHDEVGAALGGLLEEGGGDRMIFGRVGADHDDDVGILALVERRGHGRRADAFHQRGDRGGMAQPRAVIDIVGAEAGAYELLEQIGLFVRALGRAEARPAPAGRRGRGFSSSPRRRDRALPPRSLRGNASTDWTGRSDSCGSFADAVLADHRLQQPLRIVHVVEAEAAFDAEPVLVGRPVLAGDGERACRP